MKSLFNLLKKVYQRDWYFLYRDFKKLERKWPEKTEQSEIDESLILEYDRLKEKIERSIEIRAERKRNLPRLIYNEELPVAQRREEIVQAIRENQVVIIAGQTGSGKTTQIPKFCLEAGCGVNGVVACTQPRRIAAISVAERIAEELGETIGHSIGYKIRFGEQFSEKGYVKVMTDGMLLAETQGDPFLNAYDCIIIDEAHERSLNIDFILGILRNLLKKRKNLKVVITSATIDTEKFSKAFNNAPVIEVSGRTYPVEVRYQPPEKEEEEATWAERAVKATQKLVETTPGGDILVFMPTEQDIKETVELLNKQYSGRLELLPLYARLSQSEQKRVFASVNRRKIIVSTNIAETSLTIPGIRYVVDTGVARISTYSPSARTMALPVSPISRSSADQRKGRCGRIENGICIRLYSEEDYNKRSLFTSPEILRTNLAEVILRMISLKLHKVQDFPFVDKPSPQGIKDGYDLLLELSAVKKIKDRYSLTEAGRIMAFFPVDPRDSRMIIEGIHEGCVEEMTILAAALSIHDPRERPEDKAGSADEKHKAFVDEASDFITLLNIWKAYQGKYKERAASTGKVKRWCKENYLSFRRMREWNDIYRQLVMLNKENEIKMSTIPEENWTKKDFNPAYSSIHRCLLAGYLSNIAYKKEKNFYQLTRSREGMLFPGSGLFNRGGDWVCSFEQVKTSRLFLRTCGNIDPDWLERLGGDLCKSSFSNPLWDKNQGDVTAMEKVTLFGLPIVYERSVSYGEYKKEDARRIFIKFCLVDGEITPENRKEFSFIDYNLSLIEKIQKMEAKLRRKNILINEEAIEAFYIDKIPDVYSIRGLRNYLRKKNGGKFLKMKEEDLLMEIPEGLLDYPDTYTMGDKNFSLKYSFDPGEEKDGVTVVIPAAVAKEVPKERLDTVVPGLYKERILAMLKSLPKEFRKKLVPLASSAEDIVKNMDITDKPLKAQLSNYIYLNWRFNIPVDHWDDEKLPEYLRTRISIVDTRGNEIAAGRDGNILYDDYSKKVGKIKNLKKVKARLERDNITKWDIDELPEQVKLKGALFYPALKVVGNSASIHLFDNEKKALRSHKNGVALLCFNALTNQIKAIKHDVSLKKEDVIITNYFRGEKAYYTQFFFRLIQDSVSEDIRTEEQFFNLKESVSGILLDRAQGLTPKMSVILNLYKDIRMKISRAEEGAKGRNKEFFQDLNTELDRLCPKDFILQTEDFNGLIRYLKALEVRTERGVINVLKDKEKRDEIRWYEEAYDKIMEDLSPAATVDKLDTIKEYQILLEEFRVSLYAQEIKIPVKVSSKRLDKLLDKIEVMI